MRRIFTFILRYRLAVLALLLALTAWFGSFLWPLESVRFDFSFKRLFLAYGGNQDQLREYQSDFGDDVGLISILFVMPESSPPAKADEVSGTVFEPEVVRALMTLTENLKQTREIDPDKVAGLPQLTLLHAATIIPNYLNIQLQNLDAVAADHEGWDATKAIHGVEGRGAISHPPPKLVKAVRAYQEAKAALMRHRLYVGQVISKDARATRVIGRFGMGYSDDHQRAQVTLALTAFDKLDPAEAKRLKALNIQDVVKTMPAGIKVHVSGVPVIQRAYTDITVEDMTTFTPFISLMMALLLFVLFRHVHAMILPMTAVGFATVWGMGFMQMRGEPISHLTSVVPVLVLVIGVADAIHIIARYYQVSHVIRDKREAIISTMEHMAPPCSLAALTTSVGFASLLTANIPSVRAFGIYSAYAIIFAFFVQMTLIPIGLSFVKTPDTARFVDRKSTFFGVILEWITQLVLNRPTYVLAVSGFLLVMGGVGVSLVSNESRALEELHSDHPVSQSLVETQEHLAGVLVHAVAFKGKEYPDQTCSNDEDCIIKTCNPKDCSYPDCCHTRSCRKVDRVHRFKERLRINANDMTDADELKTVQLFESVIERFKSRRFSHSSASAVGDAAVEEDEEDIVEEDTEDGENSVTAVKPPQQERKTGICVETVKNAAVIHALAELDDWLSQSKKHSAFVSRVISLPGLMREMNVALKGLNSEGEFVFDNRNYSIPKNLDRGLFTDAVHQLTSAPGDILSRTVTKDYDRTNLTILANDEGTKAWSSLRTDLEAKLKEKFDNNPHIGDRFTYYITGSSTLAQGALFSMVHDIGTSISLAFLFILILISILFRSVKVGLIAMVPNLLPLLFTLALMGYAGISLRVSSVIIFSISLGIAVDDTIHFLARLHEEALQGHEMDVLIRRTMHGTGRAVVLTTVILCFGLLVNALSEFIAMEQFGVLSAFTLCMALLGVLFLLPVLVRLFRLDRNLAKASLIFHRPDKKSAPEVVAP